VREIRLFVNILMRDKNAESDAQKCQPNWI